MKEPVIVEKHRRMANFSEYDFKKVRRPKQPLHPGHKLLHEALAFIGVRGLGFKV